MQAGQGANDALGECLCPGLVGTGGDDGELVAPEPGKDLVTTH